MAERSETITIATQNDSMVAGRDAGARSDVGLVQ